MYLIANIYLIFNEEEKTFMHWNNYVYSLGTNIHNM